MKLQDTARKHPPFDVPAGLAAALLAQGYILVTPEVKKPTPNLQWAARPGFREGDYQYPPIVTHSCSTCGQKGYTESQKGTAHTSTTVRHCGVVERCPESVGARYVELFNEWRGRSRRPAKQVSASDTRFLRTFGLKTSTELIAEAMAGAKR